MRSFVPVVAQGGWKSSRVLGLEIAALDGRVRLRHGTAELRTSDEIIQRLGDRVDELVAAADQRLAAAEARAETAEARVRVDALLTVLGARGLVVDEAARLRITSCADPRRLDGWIRRAVTVGDVAALFDDAGG